MRLRLPSLRLLVPGILALAAGCAAADTSTGEGEDDVRAGERSILGRPKDYAADKTQRARSEAGMRTDSAISLGVRPWLISRRV